MGGEQKTKAFFDLVRDLAECHSDDDVVQSLFEFFWEFAISNGPKSVHFWKDYACELLWGRYPQYEFLRKRTVLAEWEESGDVLEGKEAIQFMIVTIMGHFGILEEQDEGLKVFAARVRNIVKSPFPPSDAPYMDNSTMGIPNKFFRNMNKPNEE